MGRILEYVVLLSSLTLVLGVQHHREASHGSNYEREKQRNLTHVVKQYFPKERSDVFGKKILPLDMPPHLRRMLSPPKPKQMRSSLGLRAYASESPEWRFRRKNLSNNSHFFSKSALPPFSQGLYPRKNSKMPIYHGETSQRLSIPEDFSRRYHKDARMARHHQRYSPKACDPCNSVPWVPLLKVPDSYRQQRTHVTEIHPTPQQNFNLDYHGFATDNHNVFLPPVPLVPPLDGTISSSFGLPLGNIPTGHGLLAPINPLATVATHGLDYNSLNFLSPPGLLEGNSFPELSPVPIVPIHDSGQFYQFDSTIPDLVPPPSQNMDVSKVVLTISEDNTQDLQPPKPPPKSAPNSSTKDQNIDFEKLEIVKSIPLAEFTSSNDKPSSELPLYPPLQSEYSTGYDSKTEVTDHPKSTTHSSYTSKTSPSPPKSDPQGEHSAPKPLTSPSLSWLFSDHTAPPSDSKAAAASVSSFVTESQEIASAVNNELRPVSPHSLANSPPNKGKKIQIIIPYTTKNKNDRDNNALESVRHEVFQPPGSGSTVESESSSDFAYSATTALAPEGEVVETELKTEEHKNRKYLNEMHHIIASNIRELLKEEIEKSKKEQNYPLQNNIDNWTALEYSNHKTLETKAPKEIITQALAVTSIPGTSMSHLLLPSKKIPDEYFVTTPSPNYDEPITLTFKAANSTVNSSPFTARPYATTSLYTPARALGEREKPPASNHGTTYSEVGRGRVNSWGKLNENLVLPEARSKTRRKELPTTRSGSPFRLPGTERLEIVTPVPLTTQRNYTTTAFRRTTREVGRTEEATTALEERAETTTTFRRTTEETTTALGRREENTTELRNTTEEMTTALGRRGENTTELRNTTEEVARTEETTTETRRPSFLSRFNSTRLERVSNLSSPFSRKFVYTRTTNQIRNSSRTSGSVTVQSISAGGNETTAVTRSSGSINDVFPFRNKELPWQTNLNSSNSGYRTKGERKSLIKQVNLQRSRATARSS